MGAEREGRKRTPRVGCHDQGYFLHLSFAALSRKKVTRGDRRCAFLFGRCAFSPQTQNKGVSVRLSAEGFHPNSALKGFQDLQEWNFGTVLHMILCSPTLSLPLLTYAFPLFSHRLEAHANAEPHPFRRRESRCSLPPSLGARMLNRHTVPPGRAHVQGKIAPHIEC